METPRNGAKQLTGTSIVAVAVAAVNIPVADSERDQSEVTVVQLYDVSVACCTVRTVCCKMQLWRRWKTNGYTYLVLSSLR